jgi:hypothetical protein
VQAVPEAVAIKLIGDSFYFHVAYLFKSELEMLRLTQYFTLKKRLNIGLDRLENA